MTYLMDFSSHTPALRPADNAQLQLQSTRGAPLEVYLLRKFFHTGAGVLMAVPMTEKNIDALGLTEQITLNDASPMWIVPPFSMIRAAFRAGGAFIRDGNIPAHAFDPTKTNVLIDTHETFRPDLNQFVPGAANERYPLGTPADTIDRSTWKLRMWERGVNLREANPSERTLPSVPWTVFALGDLDLWLEQYRCWVLGQEIPTTLSYPEHDIDAELVDEFTTTTGLHTEWMLLDAAADELQGQAVLILSAEVDSAVDKAVREAGFEPNGYFWDSVVRFLFHVGEFSGDVMGDPQAENLSLTGDPILITTIRLAFNELSENLPLLQQVIERATAATGIQH